jgi:hypothetical protein
MTSLRKFEWEAIAGLIAAVVAIVLHFLHATDANILRVITLVLVALLFLRDLRSEERWSTIEGETKLSVRLLEEIKETTHPAELDLIGPTRLRHATTQLAGRAQGEVVWFNACPQMFEKRSCAVHHDRKIPGYIVHVRSHSELIGRLREVERACRLT